MKKTYPTSTKAQQWARHLKPEGKRAANKSTRRINKDICVRPDEELAVRPANTRKKKRCLFLIEYHKGNHVWKVWKRYIIAGRRDRSLEALIKKHRNSTFAFMHLYVFRSRDLTK
jgi:hypothetical protein